MNLLISDEELKQRKEKFTPIPSKARSGYLTKYAKTVKSASLGAITE